MVTCEEMKRIENEAFARGVTAEGLMEKAGLGLAEIVRQFHPDPGNCMVFSGKGHNGGDALVAARHLARWGWQIDVHFACQETDLAALTAQKLAELVAPVQSLPGNPSLVVLDGLLGIGARGEPRNSVGEAIRTINSLRRDRGAWVLAIDIPSGLDGDSGRPSGACVEADLTATIGVVKKGLVADAATNHVGRLALVPLEELQDPSPTWNVSNPDTLRKWWPPRAFDTHKGMCGRIGIIAGSPGFTGAGRLCSAAAVKAGGGLVTLYARPDASPILSSACVPEVMVKPVNDYRAVLEDNLDVVAIGPGLGLDHAEEVRELIRDVRQPMVVDADALNILARDPGVLGGCQGPRLLTPHPGEMERLFPRQGRSREQWLEDFLRDHDVTLLLKGARTILGSSTRPERFYNTTGNPGMASGGMGDVLTGVSAALIPQMNGDVLRAAVLGAWLCGFAAEQAVFSAPGSPEFLCASQVIDHLGVAFGKLRRGCF